MNRELASTSAASHDARGETSADADAQDRTWFPANAPAIRYEGRFAADAKGGVRLGFPGVTAHLRFHGAQLRLRASASTDGVWFDVVVDGGAPAPLHLTSDSGEYTLLAALTEAEHTVDLVRRTESWQGVCTLLAFSVGAGGQLLAARPASTRRMMFIGDSVTCGEMAAWDPTRSVSGAENSSARLSYGMILAGRLGAECHLISYGGRGIIRDWQGIRDTRNAPQFYELALPDEPERTWDHRRYVPDVIGIQLGTNDFNQGIPDQNEFVNAYVEFVQKVRRDAPEAIFFLMDSPITTDEFARGPRRTALHGYLEQIVSRLKSPKIFLAPLAHYPGVPDNGHPTGAEHVAMADELEPLVRRWLNWS